MSLPTLSGVEVLPAGEHPELLAPPVATALREWDGGAGVGAFAIDAALSDTAEFSRAYGIHLEASANCVVVGGRRDGEERVAACLVRADMRADVNGVVRRALDVRKASFLPVEQAVAESGMEYGGITPLGVPAHWRVLVDEALLGADSLVVGAGVRAAKLVLPGALAARLPRAEVVTALAR